jgi:hypothetical protein
MLAGARVRAYRGRKPLPLAADAAGAVVVAVEARRRRWRRTVAPGVYKVTMTANGKTYTGTIHSYARNRLLGERNGHDYVICD